MSAPVANLTFHMLDAFLASFLDTSTPNSSYVFFAQQIRSMTLSSKDANLVLPANLSSMEPHAQFAKIIHISTVPSMPAKIVLEEGITITPNNTRYVRKNTCFVVVETISGRRYGTRYLSIGRFYEEFQGL